MVWRKSIIMEKLYYIVMGIVVLILLYVAYSVFITDKQIVFKSSIDVSNLRLYSRNTMQSFYIGDGLYSKSNNIFFSWITCKPDGILLVLRFSRLSDKLNKRYKELKNK